MSDEPGSLGVLVAAGAAGVVLAIHGLWFGW